MNNFKFSKRSLDNLKGVHPDLVKVVHLALELSPRDFIVIEGVRTLERQKEMVATGKSKTMNSYHLTGHAVDFVPCSPVSWDRKDFAPVVAAFKAAAARLNVKIECGHDWTRFPDSPHVQISR